MSIFADTRNIDEISADISDFSNLASSSTDRPEGPECGSKLGTDHSCTMEAWWTLGW